eukprot:gene17784-19560_t
MANNLRTNNETVDITSKKPLSSLWHFLPQQFESIFIDISWLDMIYAIGYVASTKQYKNVKDDLENLLGGPERVLVSLSVRSSFDMLLQVLKFPPGSEMICTNITLMDMKDIARHHGLVLKAVDVDLSTLKPSLKDIDKAVTPKTVAIMVVQLFGRKFRTDRIQMLASKHNLLLIEDCAQGFSGVNCFNDLHSDVTLFSFGSVKRLTCLGGALTFVRNQRLLCKMRQLQDCYDIQGRFTYFKKLVKYVFVLLTLNSPFLVRMFSGLVSWFFKDHKILFKSFLRAFPSNLFEMIRFQPSLPLLLLMKRRLTQQTMIHGEPDPGKIGLINAEFATACLIEKPLFVVGCLSQLRDFWLFPVLVDNANEVEKQLEKMGVSVFSEASSMVLIDNDEEQSGHLKSSIFLMQHILFLPIDKRSPKYHIEHVCGSIETVCKSRESVFDIATREGVLLRNDKTTFMSLNFHA